MASQIVEFDLRNTLLSHMGLPFAIASSPQDSIRATLQTMQANATGSVLIQNDNKLLGIFTERDFITRILGKNIELNEPIEKHMTKNPITITEEATLEQAVKKMVKSGIRHLPIVGVDQKAEKMLSVRDVIDFLAEFFPAEVLNLPSETSQRFHHREGG